VRSLVLSFVLLVVWVPASAVAATVHVDPCGGGGKDCQSAVVVVAELGELNRILMTAEPSAIEVSDAGAPLHAGTGCSLVDPSAARCDSVAGVSVFADDGDDRVEVAGDVVSFARLRGRPGDDLLIGAGGDDSIFGGTGADQLLGGGGDDLLADGDATDDTDGDVIDGGPGVDLVDYTNRTAPITVRLDRLGTDDHAGEAGENDRLVAVEGAFGGDADDVLRAGDSGASPSLSDEVDGDVPGSAGAAATTS
jgi:hypothetical protein